MPRTGAHGYLSCWITMKGGLMNAQVVLNVARLSEEVHDALRRGAGTSPSRRASIELVIETGWTSGAPGLHLLGAHIEATDDRQARILGWHDVVRHIDTARDALPATDGEVQVLRVAASLAGGGPVDLHASLFGMTPAHRRAVRRAIRRATSPDDVLVPDVPELQRQQRNFWGTATVVWFGALFALLLYVNDGTEAGQDPYARAPQLAGFVAFGLTTRIYAIRRSRCTSCRRGRRAAGNITAIAAPRCQRVAESGAGQRRRADHAPAQR